MKKEIIVLAMLPLLLGVGGALVGSAATYSLATIPSANNSSTLNVSTPSTITTTSNSCCISIWGPINNLFWVFYTSGGSWLFRTCNVAACVWSSPTAIPSSGICGQICPALSSFWVVGNNVSYVTSSNSASDSNFYFRSGRLTNGGGITWFAPEIAVATHYPYVKGLTIKTDVDGNAWVFLQDKDPSTNNNHFEGYSHSNTWNSSIDMNSGNITIIGGYLVPLTQGRLVLIYGTKGSGVSPNVNATTCSGIGCSWSKPVRMPFTWSQTSATNIGDTVEMCSYSGGNVDYLTYGYNSNTWNVSTIATGMSTVSGHDCSISTDGKNLVILYSDEYSNTYATFSTDSGSTWSQLRAIDSGLSCYQRQTLPPKFNGSFAGIWYTCYKSPFSLRFATFSLSQTATSSATTTTTSVITTSSTSSSTSIVQTSTTTTSSVTTIILTNTYYVTTTITTAKPNNTIIITVNTTSTVTRTSYT